MLWALALCVMGGRLWFLDHICSSYTCTGSSAQRYGIRASQGQEPSKELTARTLLIPRINALGLTTSFFFTESASKPHKHAHVIYIQHLYKYINVCLCPRASNSPLQMLHTGFSPLRSLHLALTVYLVEQINVAGQPLRRVLHLIFHLLLLCHTSPSSESGPYRSKIDGRVMRLDHH